MSVELATAYVSIIPSTRGIKAQLQSQMAGPLAAAGKEGGSRLGGAMAGAAGTALKAGGVAVAATFAASIAKGFGRLKAIDDARFKLQGLGHDASAVEAIMGSALASVKGTAFGLGDAATIASAAVAAGIEPGRDLTRYLTLTADAASIAGTSLTDMGDILNAVTSTGRVYGEHLNQLASRGVPIFQWLQDEYQVTAVKLRDMVSDGEVDATTFQKVIEDNIGGAALTAGGAFGGAFANMGAALGRFGATLLGPTFQAASGWFGNITGWIDTLTTRVGPLAAELSGRLAGAVATAMGWFGRLGDWWSANGPAIIDQVSAFAAVLRDTVTGAFAALSDWWSSNGQMVFDRVQALGGALANVLGGAFDVVSGVWTSVLQPALMALKDLVSGNSEEIRGALIGAFDLLTGALDTVGDVLSAVGGWMDENRGIMQGIAGFIAAVMVPMWITMGVKALVSAAKSVAAWAMGKVAALQSAAAQVVAGWRVIGGWIAQAAAAVVSGAQTVAVWAMLKADAIRSAAAHVASAGRVVAGWVMMGLQSLKAAAKVALSWLIAIGPIALVIAAVAGLVYLIVKNWDKIKDWTRRAWDWVAGKVSSVWQSITGAVSAGVGKVVTFARELPGKLMDGLRTLATTVLDFIVKWHPAAIIARKAIELWPTIRDWFTSLPGKIVSAIGDLAGTLRDKGEDVVRGLWEGIKSMGSWLADKVSSFVTDKIPGPIAKALGIKSPSTVGFGLARQVPRGMILGMEAEAGKLQAMSERLAMAALPDLAMPRMQTPAPGGVFAAAGSGTQLTVNAPQDILDRAGDGTTLDPEVWGRRAADAYARRLQTIDRTS